MAGQLEQSVFDAPMRHCTDWVMLPRLELFYEDDELDRIADDLEGVWREEET